MAECQACTRPTDVALCRGCVDELNTDLRTIPWLVDQLVITLTRQARVGERNGPRASERPLVFDLRASIDLETLRDGLQHWATAVAEQRQIVVDADREPKALALWLLRWMGAAAQHTEAGELHGDITGMIKAARSTIDRAPELRYVGPCDQCEEDLYVRPHAQVAACRTDGCDATYPIEERRVWLLEQAVDQLRTAAQLSRELPWIGGVTIDRKLINQWATRGKITRYLPHPKDPTQAPRFRVGEVIDRARQTMSGEKASA